MDLKITDWSKSTVQYCYNKAHQGYKIYRKIESQDKHIKYLYEELEVKEKEIDHMKEFLDNVSSFCKKMTAVAEQMCCLGAQNEITL